MYNTAEESWAHRGSISISTTIIPLLWEAAWITHQAKIHASIKRIPGVENIEADAALQLTHLPVHAFLKYFNTYFPQPTPWRLSLLPSGVTPRLHIMLLTKQSPKASPLWEYTRTTQHGNGGTPSAHGCTFPTTSKISKTRSPSYRSSLIRSAQASWRPTTSTSTSATWNNTSAPWDRSSLQWGPLTRYSTAWVPSTFAWDDSLQPLLVRIRQLNSPYHTKVNKYIPTSSVDTQITLAGKVALATHSDLIQLLKPNYDNPDINNTIMSDNHCCDRKKRGHCSSFHDEIWCFKNPRFYWSICSINKRVHCCHWYVRMGSRLRTCFIENHHCISLYSVDWYFWLPSIH